jgi:2-dehydropantoate 2-reductase
MRILVVGAGAIGGYFGGRLLDAGRDVRFLVRPRRAAQLQKTGLAIRSSFGDVTLPAPPTISAEALREPADLILFNVKAYDFEAAAAAFAPAVGPGTAILPLLNGMAHLDFLNARFGARTVLGGLCVISVTLNPEGHILHLNDQHLLAFGEQDGSASARCEAIAAAFAGARFESRLSRAIVQDMWEKWVLIATSAGINCLMRANVGDIVAAGGTDLAVELLDECAAIAARHGHAPTAPSFERTRKLVTTPGSAFAASMLRDIERGAPIEADHIIGDLVSRGGDATAYPLLRIVLANLKAYEARRAREQAVSRAA